MNICDSLKCNNDYNTNNDSVFFIYSTDELIATVELDAKEIGTLQILPGDVILSNQVSSTILDITLFNEFGVSIQPLYNIEVCFSIDDTVNKEDSCLGYFNEETREWECEDKCMDEKENLLCGKTGIIYSFVLLNFFFI